MLSRRPERPVPTSVALAFAVFLVLMTAVSVYCFWAKIWWFPPAINDFGHEIDAQFARTFLITGIVFGRAAWRSTGYFQISRSRTEGFLL